MFQLRWVWARLKGSHKRYIFALFSTALLAVLALGNSLITANIMDTVFYPLQESGVVDPQAARHLGIMVAVLVGFKYGIWGEGLPLGMSFYTFQMLSYLIDVYGGKYEREISFLHLATYVTMFPQLLSGPLTGYDEQRGSLYSREYGRENVEEGLKVFTLGLAEKVLLADRVGLLWNEVQVTGVESVSMPLAWMAAIAYSMRIYFDFNGYSLMAIGLGRMLGFQLPENFRDPYMATSVRDFYRRWHITLGRWFGKYVYIPLGGNRKGMLRTVRNLMAVWFLTAVWHGSTANFLIWGGHAVRRHRAGAAGGGLRAGKVREDGRRKAVFPFLCVDSDHGQLGMLRGNGHRGAAGISGQDVRGGSRRGEQCGGLEECF